MFLAYLDESYDARLYWMAALLCPDDAVGSLTRALDDVVRKASSSYAELGEQAELHGHDLFHGKGAWKPLLQLPRARIGIYHAAVRSIVAHDVEILIEGVDVTCLRQRFPEADHPHTVVLSHLLERIDDRAEHRHAGQSVLTIADQVDRADSYRQKLWHFQRHATLGQPVRELRHIVDTLYFVPSSASRLVQAADLIAFLNRRVGGGGERDQRAARANDVLWSTIQPRVIHHRCWRP